MEGMEGTFSMTFIVLKEFSIYGLEVSSGILSSISRWIHSNFFYGFRIEFELGGRSKSRRSKIKKVSRTLLWLQTCPFLLGLAQQKGVKIVPTIWGKNSSYSNVLGSWEIYLWFYP